ncbi:MAG TPA: type IV toxin-antitoxin system AbiEi family antitoxin domain-containing protein [Bryobacteraceae bacterium]|jgi:hypothetical protein
MRGKLNWLQRVLPEGLIVDSGWLEQHDISRQLRHKYVAHGWLLPLARGVYCKSCVPDEISSIQWQDLLISLNTLHNLPAAAGARTALELHGFSHYLSSAVREAHLYANGKFPGWVLRVPLDTRLALHNARKLFKGGDVPAYPAKEDVAFPPEVSGFTQQEWRRSKYPLILSTPERAILEILDELPQRETFHQVDVLMDGLRNLSPRRLQALLSDCNSVKVKRLFFLFAERHNHAWLRKLDPSAIDLGKGRRMLVRGGKLDPKYNITVPENFDASV